MPALLGASGEAFITASLRDGGDGGGIAGRGDVVTSCAPM